MIGASGFLGTAKSRLLPPSVPFRFFVAATVCHVLLWGAVLFAANDFPRFRGGAGPALAAVHLLTLGVLTFTAVGAAVQLLPVATTKPLAAVWPIRLASWLLIPGALVLIAGMAAADGAWMIAGAEASTLGLLLFAALLADNLRRAGSMPVVRAYGWAAFASLIALVALGLALSLDDRFGFLIDHAAAARAHMILGGFGFMGMLALGFSHVLIPMFALSNAPDQRTAWFGFGAAAAAVAFGAIGALADVLALQTAACIVGAVAVGVHLGLMRVALAGGMRKRLGLSFVLIRFSWVMLALTPLAALAALQGWAGLGGPTLFGLVALGGWLMTFLLGVLQRIVPFLASMHVSRASGGPPLLTDLGVAAPLKAHAVCHLIAIAALALAIVLDIPQLAEGAALVGAAGALAFAAYIGSVLPSLTSGRTRN
ncbi:hypothetical protein DNX69_06030 [Rhodopseudomonas palustris]|uniref:NnrS family protein n=1 Tax=Rhodopseudomonas palustris TaxID=1076 RepID=A0A323ULM8_RHOPL|nr:hypothetical protein [Rhodopseudomonas palustris]PZA13023.1 hypothetical protein DNX69_06030 [Rhodopseudomonas palustris]